jgi:Uma2 family endonuclease
MSATTILHETESPLTVQQRMSFEEFLREDHEGGLAEWVDGEASYYLGATNVHQRVVDFLTALLRIFIGQVGLGKVRSAPYLMRAKEGGPGREPDVTLVAKENLHRMGDDYLHGAADLVVEVISDDSVARDYDTKFAEYQNAGVREYWIIDPRPNRQRADFYVLNARGRYQAVPVGEDGVYRSAVVPGFWLNTAWLWADEPDELAALAEIVGSIDAWRQSGTNTP